MVLPLTVFCGTCPLPHKQTPGRHRPRFKPNPVIVGQNTANGVKMIEHGCPPFVKGPEVLVGFNAGPIDKVALAGQKIGPMPEAARYRLVHIQVKYRLHNSFPSDMEAVAGKSSHGKDHAPGRNGQFPIVRTPRKGKFFTIEYRVFYRNIA